MNKGHNEPWERNVRRMRGRPVGISLSDGRGTSGILCDADERQLWVLEYLYHDQFAMKHYDYRIIRDVFEFPSCRKFSKH